MDRIKTLIAFKIKESWSHEKYYKHVWTIPHHTIPTNFPMARFMVKEF